MLATVWAAPLASTFCILLIVLAYGIHKLSTTGKKIIYKPVEI